MRKAGFHVVMCIVGVVLGTALTIPVLALGGLVVRMPGVKATLDSVLTAEYDAPLMFGLLLLSWMLGVVVIYALVTVVFKSRIQE